MIWATRIYVVIVLVILVHWENAGAFESITDSIKYEISILDDDTTKVKLLCNLGRRYWYTNPDTSIILCKNAIALASDLDAAVQKGIAERYLAVALTYLTKYSKALDYCEQSLATLEAIPNFKEMAATYTSIGIIWYYQGDFPKAIDNYLKSLTLKEKINDKNGIAVALNNIGIIYWQQKELQQALKYYFKTLKLEKELIKEALDQGKTRNQTGVALTYNNIGNIYSDLALRAFENSDTSALKENYTKSMEYYSYSLKLQEKLGDKMTIASTVSNMSNIYNDLAKYELLKGNRGEMMDYFRIALTYEERAYKLRKELGDPKGIATSLINIGQIKLALHEPVEQLILDYGMPC